MTERFLRYSLEHARKIRLMIQDEKGIRRINAVVTQMDESAVYYVSAGAKKEKSIGRPQILAADYARGDDGDTLKNERE